jgi:hypothetical protein
MGVDDTFLDFAQPYTITGTLSASNPGDSAYNNGTVVPPVVSAINLDNEVIPEPTHAWAAAGAAAAACWASKPRWRCWRCAFARNIPTGNRR